MRLLGYVIAPAAWAFAAAALWNWFIAPLGVVEIGPLAAAGVSITVWFFVGVAYGFEPMTPRHPERYLAAAVGSFAVGWLVHVLQVWGR